jgi:ABC-type Fe2+-enterobactin transport system substrate-binding protein
MEASEYVEVCVEPVASEDWPRVFDAITGTHETERHPYRSAYVERTVDGNILHLRIPIGEEYSFTDRFQVLMCRLGRAGLL